MFGDLRELYQEVILDHGTNPRNHHPLEGATCQAHGNNPMCGDTLTVYLKLGGDGRVEAATFEGRGCAISMASASMMTEVLKGKTAQEIGRLFRSFHSLCTGEEDALDPGDQAGDQAGDQDSGEDDDEDLERLNVLAGVREFPVRVKCATLPWHTMKAAMSGEDEVSTE